MRKSAVIALVAFFVMCIMAKDLAALAWDIWYVANKEYVARELCVNKAKPKMHCNGKCHLAKQLQKLEEPVKQQKPQAPGTLKLKTLDWIPGQLIALPVTECVDFPTEETRPSWPEMNKAPHSFSPFVFRPPAMG